MDRLDDGVRRRRQEAIDQMRKWDWPGLGAPVALELGPDAREGRQRPVVVDSEPDHILLGLWVRLWCLLREAVERDQAPVSGFSHTRQCGDEVLRMFVTGGHGDFGGGGMPHRIKNPNSRSVATLRTTGG